MTIPATSPYRHRFASVSFGTEQEFKNVSVIMPQAGLPDVIATVTKGDEVLVEITKDIEDRQIPNKHTIELRTTPTEFVDEDGWYDRLRAMWVAVSYVESAQPSPLQPDPYKGYEMSVLLPGAAFPGGKAEAAGNQATVGIPVSELGSGLDGPALRNGRLHEYLRLPWYVHSIAEEDALWLDERDGSRIAFALIISAIVKLANIWDAFPEFNGRVNALAVKNAWGVRPRTSPAKLFEMPGSGAALQEAVADFQLPDALPDSWAEIGLRYPVRETWLAARAHILAGRPMGGHPALDAVIDNAAGQPGLALLFEHRLVGPAQFPGKFWTSQATFEVPVAD